MRHVLSVFLLSLSFLFPLFSYQDKFEVVVNTHLPPRRGAPHIHWCTMCGADNRYKMLKETISIIEPYFDEIHVIDNGSTDETPTLANLSPKVTYKRIENWDGNWARCYFESIRNVRKNEWFMFHDSDERPSPELLKNLRQITRWANANHVNVFTVQSCHHNYDDAGNGTSSYEKVISEKDFEKHNFLRRQDMDISAHGTHSGFHLKNPKSYSLSDLSPFYFYNHYKSVSSVRVSSFCGIMYPTFFSGLAPYTEEILRVREELGITKFSQLYQMLYTKEIPQKLLDLISTWEHAPGSEARESWELVIRDGCFYDIPTTCDQPCCAYENKK